MSKSVNQRQHAKKRAEERFGFALTKDIRNYLIGCISKKIESDSVFWYAESNRVHHHLVTYEGKLIHIVYDKVRHNIVTLLYPSKEAKSFMISPGVKFDSYRAFKERYVSEETKQELFKIFTMEVK